MTPTPIIVAPYITPRREPSATRRRPTRAVVLAATPHKSLRYVVCLTDIATSPAARLPTESSDGLVRFDGLWAPGEAPARMAPSPVERLPVCQSAVEAVALALWSIRGAIGDVPASRLRTYTNLRAMLRQLGTASVAAADTPQLALWCES